MRIATWNINGMRARLDFLLHWLEARQPDVVGLQELKLANEHFPHERLAEIGYQSLAHGQKAWNGVAILSREPAKLLEEGLAGQADFGARLISAEVAGLEFTTVYCPNGKSTAHSDFPRKLAWFDDLIERTRQPGASGCPRILCGDFNICPTPLDTWSEERHAGQIFHTPEERDRFQQLLQTGLVDLFRTAHPDSQSFSWWDYRGGSFHKNHGLRIDFVLGSTDLVARLGSSEIDRSYRKKIDDLTPSDHAPVVVELA